MIPQAELEGLQELFREMQKEDLLVNNAECDQFINAVLKTVNDVRLSALAQPMRKSPSDINNELNRASKALNNLSDITRLHVTNVLRTKFPDNAGQYQQIVEALGTPYDSAFGKNFATTTLANGLREIACEFIKGFEHAQRREDGTYQPGYLERRQVDKATMPGRSYLVNLAFTLSEICDLDINFTYMVDELL